MATTHLDRSERAARLQYLPALDGLRGVAVFAVLLFHAQFSWMRGGFLGVSAFFTLSGFLITTLLLVERDNTGRITLRRFWARRARRLMPGAFLAIGLIILYGVFAANRVQRDNLHADVLSTLAYAANWRFIFHHQSYAEVFSGTPSPVLHFWSLAIEEQFYVVFPLLATFLLWLGRGRIRIFAAVLAIFTVASIVAGHLMLDQTNGLNRVYYGTDTRAAELLIGGLLAVALVARKPRPQGVARVAMGVAGTASFVVLLVLWSKTQQNDRWLYEGGFALHALLTAFVIAESMLPGPLSLALSLRPLRWLGRISYGVYLYHWPVFLWLSPARSALKDVSRTELFALRLVVTLAIATISFYAVERPVRTHVRLGRRIPATWPRVVAPVTAVALVAAVLAVPRPTTPPSVVFTPISKGPTKLSDGPNDPTNSHDITAPIASRGPTTTTVGKRDPTYHRAIDGFRPIRILVVGDSVGATLGRGFELWAMHSGRAQVWNAATPFCSLARYAPRITGVGRLGPQSAMCDSWATRWSEMLKTYNPDVTIVLYTVWELVQRKPASIGQWVSSGDPRYDAWQLQEYERAVDVLSSRGGKVLWLTVPCQRGDGPFGVTNATDQRIRFLNKHQIGGVAKARPKAVRVVDLYTALCPNGQFRESYRGITQARPDGAHFSDPGAVAVANWLMGKILSN